MRGIRTVLLVCAWTLAGGLACTSDEAATSADAVSEAGVVLPTSWTPSGTAAAAEELFWETFQNQRYGDIPMLLERLKAEAADPSHDVFTQALMNGRIGFLFMWIITEGEYAATAAEVPDSPAGLSLPEVPRAPNGKLFEVFAMTGPQFAEGATLLQANGVEIISPIPQILGAQLAAFYFGRATRLVLDYESDPPRQLQNWSGADTLVWRTFPGVVTGFFAAFDGFPGGTGSTVTMPMSKTNDAVSYSLGFNFATPFFTHLGEKALGAEDLAMWSRLIQLAADPRLQGVRVFGSDTDSSGSDPDVQDALVKAFHDRHSAYWSDLPIAYDPVSNPQGIWKVDETPANIVKASVGSSSVAPFDFENNLLLFGDVLVANYQKPGDGVVPPADWKEVARDAYDTARQSPQFDRWRHRHAVLNRLVLVDSGEWDTLERVAQNYPVRYQPAIAGLPEFQPNPLHYAGCMVCHQRGSD